MAISMGRKDPYQILGVHPSADHEEIRQAYRHLAKQHHPDCNPGDKHSEDRFKEISGAYQVLRDPKKRAEFDRRGFRPSMTHSAGPSPFESRGNFAEIFDHLFSDIFPWPDADLDSRAERGKDLKYQVSLSLADVARGATKPLQITRQETCEQCAGIGTSARNRPQLCVVCGGLGYVRRQHGLLDLKAPCRACGGTGEVILDACKRCGGTGRIRKERALNVRVPPGAEEGLRLKVRGEGDEGVRGGRPGDLLVTIGVRPHEHFRREGGDIHGSLTVSMVEAALGCDLQVPTLDGSTAMKLPAGVQSGAAFRLRGKGLPKPGGGHSGDQVVRIHVETPTRMSRRQRELLREFTQTVKPPEPSPDSPKRSRSLSVSGLLSKLNQWFRGPRRG
ncbi:MAG: molecular chaperone DnaJ [Nitrospinota bacterium]